MSVEAVGQAASNQRRHRQRAVGEIDKLDVEIDFVEELHRLGDENRARGYQAHQTDTNFGTRLLRMYATRKRACQTNRSASAEQLATIMDMGMAISPTLFVGLLMVSVATALYRGNGERL